MFSRTRFRAYTPIVSELLQGVKVDKPRNFIKLTPQSLNYDLQQVKLPPRPSLKDKGKILVTSLLELFNLPKLAKNILKVKKNPTLDGITSVTSTVESILWRGIGSGITAGIAYVYSGSWAIALTMVAGDFITKIAAYAGVKKALKKVVGDKKLSLLAVFGNSLLWRLKGSTVTGAIFFGLTGDPVLAKKLFLWDCGLKLSTNTAFSWAFEQIDHAWKFLTIPDYRANHEKPLLLKLRDKWRSAFTKKEKLPA